MQERTSDTVDPVTPLFVHEVAMTTINAPAFDGSPNLFPVIGVWADLTPVRDAGVPVGENEPGVFPVMVATDSVLESTDPTMMNLIIAATDPELISEQAAIVQDPQVAPFSPYWSVRLPTAWVATALVVTGTPLQLRILLVDGLPPVTPSGHTLSLTDPAVVLLPSVDAVHNNLARVMNSEWTTPIPMQMEMPGHIHDDFPEIDVMRDQLWVNTVGVALGQERAFNRAVSYAEWVSNLENSDGEDQIKFDDAMQAADWLAESSMLEPVLVDEDGQVQWPTLMAGLRDKIEESTNPGAVEALHEKPFELVVDTFGVFDALMALTVLTAARSHNAVQNTPPDDVEQGRYTIAYLIGMWLDEHGDIPWWATRATHQLLLHHDTETLVDLLVCNTVRPDLDQDGHSPLSFRFLHVVTEALNAMRMNAAEFTDRVQRLDVTPPELTDIIYVCQQLMLEAANASHDDCEGCSAASSVIAETLDQKRLVRAAVGALPLIADLDADVHGLAVGDEAWTTHREGFLMHWMNHTAIVPDEV